MPWTGLDLDGNPVTHPDRDALIALLQARDARIRRARLGTGQDPCMGDGGRGMGDGEEHPITWESTAEGEPIGFGRALARIDRRLDARAALKGRRAARWGIGPSPAPGAA